MCEQANEIQLKWEPQNGDFAYTKGDDSEGGNYTEGVKIIWNGKMVHSGFHNWDDNWYLPSCHWLPRQDQLQAMITADMFGWQVIYEKDKLDFFWNFVTVKTEYKNISFEQMWLVFVMREKYSKKWNGGGWVKE